MTINDAMIPMKSFLPAVIWLMVITLLSTEGGVSMPSFNLIQMDKLAHAAAYGLLVWLCLFGLYRYKILDRAPTRLGVLVFLLASVYGAFMEVVQYAYFPNRHFELDDMLANTAGAAIGWWLFSKMKHYLPAKPPKSSKPL